MRVSLEKLPWQVLRKGTWFRFIGGRDRRGNYRSADRDLYQVVEKTDDRIRLLAVPEYGDRVHFREFTRDEINARRVQVSGWPRRGVRPIQKSDVPIRMWKPPKPSKKLFKPEPFKPGDWVRVAVDGQTFRAQMWSENWAVAETPDGNRFVHIERHRATKWREARYTTPGGSTVTRIPAPYEQLELA